MSCPLGESDRNVKQPFFKCIYFWFNYIQKEKKYKLILDYFTESQLAENLWPFTSILLF